MGLPRGFKFVLLTWAVFTPYFVWYFGRLFLDVAPPFRVQSPVFFAYLIVGITVVTFIWGRLSRNWPPEPESPARSAPWIAGFSIVMMAIGFAVLMYGMARKNASARAYVDQGVPSILASRTKQELVRQASRGLQQRDGDVDAFLAKVSVLGDLVAYEGSEGRVRTRIAVTPRSGDDVLVGSFVARARFAKGEAQILVGVIRDGTTWHIDSIDAVPDRTQE